MSKQKVDRWYIKNQKKRAENDFNRVMCAYVTHKYGPIAKEVCEFYDHLRGKYPTRKFYKGSKGFKAWVNNQIVMYCAEHPSSADEQDAGCNQSEIAAQPAPLETDPVAEMDVLSSTIREVGLDEMQPVAQHVIIAPTVREEQQQQQELDDLDNILDQIIADLEAGQDEGVVMDPVLDEVDEALTIPVDGGEPLVEWW